MQVHDGITDMVTLTQTKSNKLTFQILFMQEFLSSLTANVAGANENKHADLPITNHQPKLNVKLRWRNDGWAFA
jgi:hypothetical protein